MFDSSFVRRAMFAVVLLISSAASAAIDQHGYITGIVLLEDDTPVADAEVEIVGLHRRLRVDDHGSFHFDRVPVGRHLVAVDSLRHGGALRDVEVAPGRDSVLTIRPELTSHRDTIVVSASPIATRKLEVGSAADVLTDQELLLRAQLTIGGTLSNQVGVHETGFASGASRPILRGLGSDRVRMLASGIGTGDVSETSPDHAVAAQALTAERIEVLRGPATLLYGSNAIGGVVNVLDESIPSHLPVAPLSGTLDLGFGSTDDGRDAAARLRGGVGAWAWSVHGLSRQTSNYEIPGFANVEEDEHGDHGDEEHGDEEQGEEVHGDEHEEHGEEENPPGVLTNSDTDTEQVGVGVSYFFGQRQDAGFVGVSVSGLESNYGIPEGGHVHAHGDDGESEQDGDHGEEHGDEEEGGIRIDLQRTRYDVRGAVTQPFAAFESLSFRLGITEYEHDEIEGNGTVGTRFENDSWEGRLELIQATRGRWSGAFGLQGGSRDFAAVGEEALVPPTTTDSLDAFVYQQVELGSVDVRFGARWANRELAVSDPEFADRSFDGLSGSVGVVWTRGDSALGVSLARSVKFPSPEELYSFGPHAGTRTFDLGNSDLQEESSLGVDLFYRWQSNRVRGEITLFVNDFSDFIFAAFTGAEEDGFEVVDFRQQDAEFTGGELDLTLGLVDSKRSNLDLRLMADFVNGELADGSNVPRLPPLRLGAGLHARSGPWSGMVEVRWVDDQTSVAESETPTPGYMLVNTSLGYRLITDRVVYDFLLRGTNLTDEEVRLHTSYLKNLAPQPGRDINVSLRLSF